MKEENTLAKVIRVVDRQGEVLLERFLIKLPLREEKVIEKSIEMFCDSDPCIIHKTYAMKKIYIEIDDYFNAGLKSGTKEYLWEDIPENIGSVIEIKQIPYKVIIE